ncbi:MAG: efflux RND transporter periplasmic adaptor subunit [Phycisphaerales bacterium]|nr:MAG: efflux RND transporter periplasmic adaptor subunit [Phycisphaerales bacterium]
MHTMKKSWLIVLVVVAVVVALAMLGSFRARATLRVVSPTAQTIRAYIEEQAVTELPQDFLISTPISGWLEPIDLREGDRVQKGQVVARLETDDLRDRVHQVQQRIAVLETQIAETSDHRLEEDALIQTNATVKAIDETVKAAEAKLEATQALLDFTQSEVRRLKGLVEVSSVSERELREADMEFRRARAEYQSDSLELAALKTIAAVSYIGPKYITDYIDRKSFTLEQRQKELVEARTQLQIEQRNLSRAEIRSPVDGVVLNRHQTRRQFLSAGTPLLTVGRLDDIEVIAEVLTQRATRIEPGDPVDIYGESLPEGPVHGRVLRVYPAGFKKISSLGVEQQRVKVAVRLDLRPNGLGVAFRVYVRIFYDRADNALVVPRTCLFRGDNGGWNVMLVRDGRIELRPVTVGLMNEDVAQITAGLGIEDMAVAQPSHELQPGMRVKTADHPDSG